jgi:two-component system, chemotaxis family, chemotaxis protein CheY
MAKKIMIVDDASSIRQSLSYVLQQAGYEVIEAVDGADALKKIAGEKVSLIVSDVNMPNMDGLTFVKTLKSDPQYADNKFTPVVMLTTEAGEDKKNEGKEPGVKAWMTKPFPPDKLLEAVSKLVG